MEQRLSVVTLGVADLARARRFYEEGLGWRRANSEAEVVFYQAGGMVLALFGWDNLATDANLSPEGSGFRGVALAYNVRSREEVGAVLAEAEAAGGTILKPAQEVFWGGILAISPTRTATSGKSPTIRSGRWRTTARSASLRGTERSPAWLKSGLAVSGHVLTGSIR